MSYGSFGQDDPDGLYRTPTEEEIGYIPSQTAAETRSKKSSSRVLYLFLALALVSPFAYYSHDKVQELSRVATNSRPFDVSLDSETVPVPSFFSAEAPVSSQSSTTTTTTTATNVEIVVTTEYGELNPANSTNIYPFLTGNTLMEPFRDNTAVIRSSLMSDYCNLDWTIEKDSDFINENEQINVEMGEPVINFSGSSPVVNGVATIIVQPQSTEKYNFKLSQSCSDFTNESIVWVKYIRRELKRLTDEDRVKLLSAMNTMWRVNTVDGMRLYGDGYKSAYYFTQIHIDAAGNNVCDMFHGDVGYLTAHVYLTNFFEQSMQLVDPSVSLHYYEYAEMFSSQQFQNHMGNLKDGGSSIDILNEDWFGTSDPLTGVILDSIFKDIEPPRINSQFYIDHGVPTDTSFFPQNVNEWTTSMRTNHSMSMWGLLKSPHSSQKNTHIERFFTMDGLDTVLTPEFTDGTQYNAFFLKFSGVTCDKYTQFLEQAIGQGVEFNAKFIEEFPHASIHRTFGGAGGRADNMVKNDAQWREPPYSFTDKHLTAISYLSHPIMKNSCKFYLADEEYVEQNFPNIQYNCSNVPHTMYDIDTLNGKDELWKTMPEFGEEGGPSCQLNPIKLSTDEEIDKFWVDSKGHFFNREGRGRDYKFENFTHEEKLGTIKLMGDRYQLDGDMTGASAPLDPLFWVQHGGVQRIWQRLLYEDIFSSYEFTVENTCSGHSATGKFYWLKGYMFRDPTIASYELTNSQLMSILDPRSETYAELFNYVYEATDYDWCPGIMETLGNKTEIYEANAANATRFFDKAEHSETTDNVSV